MLFALRSFAFPIENWCLFRIWCFVFQFVLAKPMFDVVNVQMMKIRSSWLVNQFLVIPILAIANCSQSGKITKVELCMPKQSKSIKLKKKLLLDPMLSLKWLNTSQLMMNLWLCYFQKDLYICELGWIQLIGVFGWDWLCDILWWDSWIYSYLVKCDNEWVCVTIVAFTIDFVLSICH